jgi:hypothetical protein
MYKILIALMLVFSGCSYFTINATMCEQIASDPHATVPNECIDYNEKDAQKAFDKVVDDKKTSDKDIEFNKQ